MSPNTRDPFMVRDAVAQVNFASLYGRVRFNAVGQIELPPTMVQVEKGKVVPIYGQNGFVNHPLYPMPPWNKRA